MNKAASILSHSDLFNDLSPAQAEKIIGIARETKVPANSVIMAEGKEGDSMYVLLKGTVEVIKSMTLDDLDDGRPDRNKTFSKLSAEQGAAVIGEIALLEKAERTATVRSITECILYEIKKDDFLKLAEKDFELGYRVLRNLASIVSSRLRKANEDVLKLATVLSIVLKE